MKHTDSKFLKKGQYKNVKNLSTRFAIYDFSYPKINFYDEALKTLKFNGSEKILEVGCGDGKVLINLKQSGHKGVLIGSDLSKGMYIESVKICKKEKLPIEFIETSADRLPFEDNSFDIIFAFFMIYHLPDIDIALQEWKRVLKPKGKILITMGSKDNLPNRKKLTTLMKEKIGVSKKKFTESFSFESASKILEKYFSIKNKKLIEYDLRIPDSSFVINAIESTKEFYEPKVKESLWKSCMNNIEKKVNDEIKSKGYYHDIAKRGFYIVEKIDKLI